MAAASHYSRTNVTKDGDQIEQYVAEHAPELKIQDVRNFMAEHPRPDDAEGSHVQWAVSVLRQRSEGEVGDGLSIDRVVDEIRRRH
jgi:hypothetical protein